MSSWLVVDYIYQNQKPGSPRPVVATGNLNDSSCNSSSTEVGVLVAKHLATARPFPKEVCTITGGGSQRPAITIPQGKRVPSYLTGGHSYPCTRGRELCIQVD
ncbi:hypothetical protein AVEN_7382-1 [Araneus ventricosus]|uniref:Uncharacterized protein n=1 Tax=Araneus ventricosus TaxID=182803 RepID=A0A4Y2BSY0_ARAVE|nr:hypothetical protein AVEN_7382-1 [Araneus ventricosus]